MPVRRALKMANYHGGCVREFIEGLYVPCEEPVHLFESPFTPLIRIFKVDMIGDELFLDRDTGSIYWEGQEGWKVRRPGVNA